MILKSGKIIKGVGGFYYVKCDNEIIECRARGKFRKNAVLPYVGDNVKISVDGSLGYVVEIVDRKNFFIRPPIANIDKLIIVSALSNPAPDTLFIDKMLITAQKNSVKPALCFNKRDLSDGCDDVLSVYKSIGYDVFVTSTIDKSGIDKLKSFMSGCVTAVCGFSGVGKSSLLNEITNSDMFETGEVSQKLSRGKHTTRHVELIELGDDAYIADTPGFSMISLSEDIDCDELSEYFPEFSGYEHNCKYSDCHHISDKFCGIYDAVENGDIPISRYENYKFLYNTLKKAKEW